MRAFQARRRGPAQKKDDAKDAGVRALMAPDACPDLRQPMPHRIGEHYQQFTTVNAPKRVPVARRSRRSESTFARRLACNRHLGEAVQQRAFCSLTRSAWAKEFYDEMIAVGNNHHPAGRRPGDRWLEILWHCLVKGIRYNGTIQTANRNRAFAPNTAA